MKTRIIVLVACIALGAALGALVARGFQFGGRDTPLGAIMVSADERTLAVHLSGPAHITVEETTTTVRLRAHVLWFIDVDPNGYTGGWTTVRLAVPLGRRSIIDDMKPADAVTVPRPGWLPPGYVHARDSLTFEDRFGATSVYASATGGILMITKSAAGAAGTTVPADLTWTSGDYTFTLESTAIGGVPTSHADLKRVETSVA